MKLPLVFGLNSVTHSQGLRPLGPQIIAKSQQMQGTRRNAALGPQIANRSTRSFPLRAQGSYATTAVAREVKRRGGVQ